MIKPNNRESFFVFQFSSKMSTNSIQISTTSPELLLEDNNDQFNIKQLISIDHTTISSQLVDFSAHNVILGQAPLIQTFRNMT